MTAVATDGELVIVTRRGLRWKLKAAAPPRRTGGTATPRPGSALTNVARHAPTARTVAVIVSDTGSGVTVEVTDDAPTGPSWFDNSGGYGLVGMRERVEALDGTLSAGPCPDGGWIVRAALPLTARTAT